MSRNPNLTPYPYNRTISILSDYSANPTDADALDLAMRLRAFHGVTCTLDATGCTLTTDWLTLLIHETNWRVASTPWTTKWPTHMKWVGLTQENRRDLEAIIHSFPRQL